MRERRERQGATMELRKVQLTGGSSYTVTLPKDWVEQMKISAGDVVGFGRMADGSLALVPHASRKQNAPRYEFEISTETTEWAFRKIIAAYLTGYDVIVVKSKKPLPQQVRKAVREAARRIIGIEVVDEEPNSVVLQDFLDPKEFHVEKGLRRMQALARAMQEDALRLLETEAEENVSESLEERDDEVDRLYWMINKQFHAILRDPSYAQKMELNANQALNYLLVARLIERTADHARRLAENLAALHGADVHAKLASKIERQARKAFALYGDAMTSFHKRDAAAANRIIDESQAFQSSQDAVIRESLSLGGEEILHVAYALESIGRTAAYAADIAETTINHTVAMSS